MWKIKLDTTFIINEKIYKFDGIRAVRTPKTLYITNGGVSSFVRQYIKQRWNIPFQISTATNSLGDSITVYLDNLSTELHAEISEELKSLFQYIPYRAIDMKPPTEKYLIELRDGNYSAPVCARFVDVYNHLK